jgi:hypothetical protein
MVTRRRRKLLNEKRKKFRLHRVFGISNIRSKGNDRAEDVVRMER